MVKILTINSKKETYDVLVEAARMIEDLTEKSLWLFVGFDDAYDNEKQEYENDITFSAKNRKTGKDTELEYIYPEKDPFEALAIMISKIKSVELKGLNLSLSKNLSEIYLEASYDKQT